MSAFVFSPLPPTPNLLKILKIQRAGSGQGGEKKNCCVTPLHPGTKSVLGVSEGPVRATRFYILLEEEHLVSRVPRGGWSDPPPPHPLHPPHLWTVSHAGFLVAGGGMVCEQGGIPFPLNNLLCQCSPNRALLQGCVLSLLNHRESLLNATASDREQNTFGILTNKRNPFLFF